MAFDSGDILDFIGQYIARESGQVTTLMYRKSHINNQFQDRKIFFVELS